MYICEQKIETTYASHFCSLYSCEYAKQVIGGFNVETGSFLAISEAGGSRLRLWWGTQLQTPKGCVFFFFFF